MTEMDANSDPFDLFDGWLAEAERGEPNDHNAMALATSTPEGEPSVRMVLLKGHGPDGFIFYSNSQSRKGRELAHNSHASLMFHWKSLRRQVRIEGETSEVSDRLADEYFACRSRDSQLGAWASNQSERLESRGNFMERFEEMLHRFADTPVPRPPHWRGYCVTPSRIEFWQDRKHRLHERLLFYREALEDEWSTTLLYP